MLPAYNRNRIEKTEMAVNQPKQRQEGGELTTISNIDRNIIETSRFFHIPNRYVVAIRATGRQEMSLWVQIKAGDHCISCCVYFDPASAKQG